MSGFLVGFLKRVLGLPFRLLSRIFPFMDYVKMVRYYRAVISDRRTPRTSKMLLGFAVAYMLSPIDLIPDWIPLLGQLDDVVVVGFLTWLAFAFVPEEVKRQHKQR